MKLFIGSYTRGISRDKKEAGKGVYCLELDARRGDISYLNLIPARNPSYVTCSPETDILYFAEELDRTEKPRVFAVDVSDLPRVKILDHRPLPGSYACHVSVRDDRLFVSNYGSGEIVIYKISPDGRIQPDALVLPHEGSGKDPERQNQSHLHMCLPLEGQYFFATDLGADKVYAYRPDTKNEFLPIKDGQITTPPGYGPRHMYYSTSRMLLYVYCELSAHVLVYTLASDIPELLEDFTVFPEYEGRVLSGAAIKMHPDERYLYVSERSTNTISILDISPESGMLELKRRYETLGKTPRDFCLDPSGKWLIVANQDSNELRVFKVLRGGGKLKFQSVYREVELPSGVTVT
jgi:6-phosphogluconolactonase